MKLARAAVRQLAAEKCWLDDEATWPEIWKTAEYLGKEFLENLRAWVLTLLECIPAFD
jgi:hypothetical protein